MHLETFTKTKQKNYKNMFLMKYFYWIFRELIKNWKKCKKTTLMRVEHLKIRIKQGFCPDEVIVMMYNPDECWCIRICTVSGFVLYPDMYCIRTWIVSGHEQYPDMNCIRTCILIWIVYGYRLYPDVNYFRMWIISGWGLYPDMNDRLMLLDDTPTCVGTV